MSFSLGSLAGGVAEGFTKEQQQALQQALAQQQQSGQTALGNALGGTVAQPQQQGGLLTQLLRGLGSQPSTSAPAPSSQQNSAPMGGSLMPSVGGGASLTATPAAVVPQTPPQQGQPQPVPQPQSGPIGQLTLDNVVSRVKANNPGISPRDLMAAVGQAIPLMNAQSQAQYKQIMSQLAPVRMEETIEQDKWKREHGDRTADQGDRRLDQNQQRIDQAKQRMAQHTAQADKALAEKQYEFDSAMGAKERAEAVKGLEQAVKAKQAALTRMIGAANSFDADLKPQMLKEAQQQMEEARQALAEAQARVEQEKQTPDPGRTREPDGSKIDAKAPASTRPPGSPPASPDGQPVQSPTDIKAFAKEAIANGAPRDAVLKKLKEMGGDPSGL